MRKNLIKAAADGFAVTENTHYAGESMHALLRILVVGALLLQTACDIGYTNSVRSGSLDDDYIAEPLSDRAERFASALDTSNVILELLAKSDYEAVYSNHVGDDLKTQIGLDGFSQLFDQIFSVEGGLVRFKELQWGFWEGQDDNDATLVYSVKLVEHEQRMLKYLFVFNPDIGFSKIVGVHVKPRDGVSPPGIY